MSLRNKLGAALEKCSECCLDDKEDRARVLDTVVHAVASSSQGDEGFYDVCEAMRWYVTTGKMEPDLLRKRVEVLLKALGEA